MRKRSSSRQQRIRGQRHGSSSNNSSSSKRNVRRSSRGHITELDWRCALMYALTWRDVQETIEIERTKEELTDQISVTRVPKGAYITKVHDPKCMLRVHDIIISTYPPVSKHPVIVSRPKHERTLRVYEEDLNQSNLKINATISKWSPERVPHKISDAIDRLFHEFCDPVTMRMDPWQTSAMLSSTLYAAYTPYNWPVERWFRDANDGFLTKAQLKRACEVCCVIGPHNFRPLLDAMCVNVVSSHELVGFKCQRLILNHVRNKIVKLAIAVLIARNRRNKQQHDDCTESKHKAFVNLSKSQRRLLSIRRIKCSLTESELRCQYLCAEIMSRANVVRRILMQVLQFPIRMVVFSVGVESFRSPSHFHKTVIQNLESYLGGMRLKTLVDTRANTLSRGMRHRCVQKMCEINHVEYVRINKTENIGKLRSYLSPMLILGNHKDIEESTERALLTSRLCSFKIARVVHLVSREGKIFFSMENFSGKQCIELGTKHASRVMLNAASDSDGNFFDFGWGNTVFSPLMSERLRRTSHDHHRSPW